MFYILLVLLIGSYLWAWLNVRGLEISHETFTNRSQVGEMVRERISDVYKRQDWESAHEIPPLIIIMVNVKSSFELLGRSTLRPYVGGDCMPCGTCLSHLHARRFLGLRG